MSFVIHYNFPLFFIWYQTIRWELSETIACQQLGDHWEKARNLMHILYGDVWNYPYKSLPAKGY